MEIDIADMLAVGCRRCHKPFAIPGIAGREDWVLVQHDPPGRARYWSDGRRYFMNGEALFTMTVYHEKCLPPNVFHKYAGSRPARQSPVVPSLSNEHDTAGD